jgi:hypothetical protein
MRMIEARRRPRFVQEPPLEACVAGHALRIEKLERDPAIKAHVAGEIHGAHPAGAQRAQDLVRPDSTPRFAIDSPRL